MASQYTKPGKTIMKAEKLMASGLDVPDLREPLARDWARRVIAKRLGAYDGDGVMFFYDTKQDVWVLKGRKSGAVLFSFDTAHYIEALALAETRTDGEWNGDAQT